MLFPLAFMVHTCTLQKRYRKQKVSFTSGTGTPAVGQTVTGVSTHRTAVISRVGSGYIVVKDLSWLFTVGEIIESSTWTGTVSTIADWQNQSGEYEYYWLDDQTDVPCRFGYAGSDKKGVFIHETGELLDLPVKVALPDTITLVGTQSEWASNYRIVSTVPGFTGTFQILTPYVISGLSGIDHYAFILQGA